MEFLMNLLYVVKDFLGFVLEKLMNLIDRLMSKFVEVNIFEKLIILNTITAFLANVFPVASHVIFDQRFEKVNPFGEYLIGIVFMMLITVYFPGLISLIIRLVLNTWYYGWVLYIHYGEGIIKTKYVLEPGYYVSLAVPLVYLLLSVLSYLAWRRE